MARSGACSPDSIRRVCDVVAFKAPSPTELKHDYLWRIHTLMPERGDIRIFNRSHYEDVVAAEVVGVIGDKERKRRYEHINAFEKMLCEEARRS